MDVLAKDLIGRGRDVCVVQRVGPVRRKHQNNATISGLIQEAIGDRDLDCQTGAVVELGIVCW